MIKLIFALLVSAYAGPEQILVPAGHFSPIFKDKGEEQVSVSEIKVDLRPITNEEFFEFINKNPRWQKNNISKIMADSAYLQHWVDGQKYHESEREFPVVNVSWFAARAYCASFGKRLPSTVEWEYFSDTSSKAYEAAALKWYSLARQDLASVGKGEPNKFGLLDTHSLIWEWVEDFNSVFMTADSRQSFEKDMFCAGAAINSKDPSKYAAFVRYAMRASLKGKSTSSRLGFRCVESVKE